MFRLCVIFFIFILLYTFVVSVLHQRKKWSIFVKYYLCTRGKSNISYFSFALQNKNWYWILFTAIFKQLIWYLCFYYSYLITCRSLYIFIPKCSWWNKVSRVEFFIYIIVIFRYLRSTSNMINYTIRIRREDNNIL